jgi:NifU-like protein
MPKVEERRYSGRFIEKGAALNLRGAYFQEEANNKGLALVEATAGDIKLFWLVEPEEERIVSAKYFSYGGTASMAVAEALCEAVTDKTIHEAIAIDGATIDKGLRDDPDKPSAPAGTFDVVGELLSAAVAAWPTAQAVWAAAAHVRAQRAEEAPSQETAQWRRLPPMEQVRLIDAAIEGRVRDYLQAEGGDIEIVDVIDGTKVLVRFDGMCGSCASSAGTTLFAIEDWIREKVYPELTIQPVDGGF